jgi:large subunit ribosomal protein L23
MIKLNNFDILKTPVITEKSNFISSLNKYVFIVSSFDIKKNVKLAVENIFNVSVSHVNIVNKKRSSCFFKGKKGFKSAYKKAIVTLVNGFTIDITSEVK